MLDLLASKKALDDAEAEGQDGTGEQTNIS
jgi:hypothetical protein